jgi:hypothetical protein
MRHQRSLTFEYQALPDFVPEVAKAIRHSIEDAYGS